MKKIGAIIMAGLQGSSYLFLNVSGGRLINKKKELSFFGYEGTLLKIEQVFDEYEGKPISKIKLLFQDAKSDEKAQISFSEESWYSQGFFSRIAKVDLSQPFILGVSGSEKNEKVSFCWIKQKDKVVEADKSFPRPTKNSRNKDNYDALIEATEPLIAEIAKKLEALQPKTEQVQDEPKSSRPGQDAPRPKQKAIKNEKVDAVGINPDPDDLPF